MQRSTRPKRIISALAATLVSLGMAFPGAAAFADTDPVPATSTADASQGEADAGDPAVDPAAPAETDTDSSPAQAAPPAAVAEKDAGADAVADPAAITEIWVSSTGSDDNDGSSADQALATMKKALEVQTANPGIATINLSGDFTGWTNVTIPSGVTLKIAGNTTIAAATNASGITLANGATLTAGANTLTMTGFNVAIQMNAGAKLIDGTYTISGGNRALNLNGGVIEGSADRSSVAINATGTSGADLQNGSITNATIDRKSVV